MIYIEKYQKFLCRVFDTFIQIKANGVCFEAYPSLAGTNEENIVIKFSDFVPAPWESDQTAVFTENIGNINAAGI